jgi:hypothetical protein
MACVLAMWAYVVEEMEESRVKSAEGVENEWKEGALWRDVDAWQVLGDFVLVCIAHGNH